MVVGTNGMDMVTLSSPAGDFSCCIYAHGATVTSWKHNGSEKIFCSSKAIFNGVKAIRGGIPVAFPQFGQPNKAMAQHGFARNSPWDVKCLYNSETSATVVFSMQENADTLSQWPYKFELNYFVTLSAENLVCELKICNTGSEAFSCHGLLHTYFAVDDIRIVSVRGLEGSSFLDKVTGGLASEVETRDGVTIGQEVDRIYSASAGGPLPDVEIYCGDRAMMRVAKASCLEDTADTAPSATDPAADTPVNFSAQPTAADEEAAAGAAVGEANSSVAVPTDVVVWNLWADKAAAMADMDDTEYLRFVCVEPGCVSSFIEVLPGKRLALKQVLSPQ
jgi:glucose-6-phosphate 1-epimerase